MEVTLLLIEHPISLGATGVALVLVGRECITRFQTPDHVPITAGLFIAAAAGCLGIYLGSAVVASCSSRKGRIRGLAVWGTAAVCLSVGMGFCGLLSPAGWRKLLLGGTACLFMAAYLAVLIPAWREGSFSR
jgi:hypothetical protein